MTNINLLRVSTPECHPQGVFQIKAIQAQQAKLVFINLMFIGPCIIAIVEE